MTAKTATENTKKTRMSMVMLLEATILSAMFLSIMLVSIELAGYLFKTIAVEKTANSVAKYLQNETENSTSGDADNIKNKIHKIAERQSYNLFTIEVCGTTENTVIDPDCTVQNFARTQTKPMVDANNSYSVKILVFTEYTPFTSIPNLLGIRLPKYIFYRTSVIVPPTK